jgi:hypothetical protein
MHTYTYMHTNMYTVLYATMCVYVYTYAYICIYIYIYIYIYIFKYQPLHTLLVRDSDSMMQPIHTHTHTRAGSEFWVAILPLLQAPRMQIGSLFETRRLF